MTMIMVEMSAQEAAVRGRCHVTSEDSKPVSQVKNVLRRFWQYALTADQINGVVAAGFGPQTTVSILELDEMVASGLLIETQTNDSRGSLFEIKI